MSYQFTAGARRALARATGWTSRGKFEELEAPALLLGLLGEPECRAAIVLARCGIDPAAVCRRWDRLSPCSPPDEGPMPESARLSVEVERSLQVVCDLLAQYPPPLELATEHLLLGLATAEHEVSAWLRQEGLDPKALEAEIHHLYGHCDEPLACDPEATGGENDGSGDWTLQQTGPAADPQRLASHRVSTADQPGLPTPPRPGSPQPEPREQLRVLRVLDAGANRAVEGLRAVEDYVRFVLDDRHLTGLCKQLRHDLTNGLARIPSEHRLAARETRADVGTALETVAEQRRQSAADVLAANLTRLQEALRSLEEFGKLVDPELAATLKQLRYRTYTLGRAVEITRTSLQRLDRARLYVLIDGRESSQAFRPFAESLIDAGVHVLQLRDKQLDDRRLLGRARLLRELTSGTDTLFLMNDRPDLAVLAGADGVHVGQQELPVKDARTVVGPEALIGVSTHSIEQARQGVLDGANYLGVGPVFPSSTKPFDRFPGLELLGRVASEIRLPAFAIGGIGPENLPEVLAAGFTRVAASSAVCDAAEPAAAAGRMLTMLREGGA